MKEQLFILNRNRVAFCEGQTILEAAEAAGVRIPTLCHLKGASPTGACRICVVEVKGVRSLVAACSTPVTAGLEVFTESARVVAARKLILELLLSSGNHNCAANQATGSNWTDLQLKAQQLEGDGLQWPCPDENHGGTCFLHAGGQFTCGLGNFTPVEWTPPAEEPCADYPLVLSTGRRLTHYHTRTQTGRCDPTGRPAER
jgi:predicted molibdopterin-dependent oxidoreductase YjgC